MKLKTTCLGKLLFPAFLVFGLLLLSGCGAAKIESPKEIELPDSDAGTASLGTVDLYYCNASWMKGFVSTDEVYQAEASDQIRFETADHPYRMIHDIEQGTEYDCTLSNVMSAVKGCVGTQYRSYLLGANDSNWLEWMEWDAWSDFRGFEDKVNSIQANKLTDIFSSYGNVFKYHQSVYPYVWPGIGGKKTGPLALLLKDGRLDASRLSIVITDLTEFNLPFGEIAAELNEQVIENGGAVCLIPIKSSYNGYGVVLKKNDLSLDVTGKVTEPRLLFLIVTGPKDEVSTLTQKLSVLMERQSMHETQKLSRDSALGSFTRLYFPGEGQGIGDCLTQEFQTKVKKSKAIELMDKAKINSCVRFMSSEAYDYLKNGKEDLRVFTIDDEGEYGYFKTFTEAETPAQLVLYFPIQDDETEYSVDPASTVIYCRAADDSDAEGGESPAEVSSDDWTEVKNYGRIGLSVKLSRIHADAEAEDAEEAEEASAIKRNIVYDVEGEKSDEAILKEGDYLKLVIRYNREDNELNASEAYLKISVRCGSALRAAWVDEWNTEGEYSFNENGNLDLNIDAVVKTQGLKTLAEELYQYGYPTLNAPILLVNLLA